MERGIREKREIRGKGYGYEDRLKDRWLEGLKVKGKIVVVQRFGEVAKSWAASAAASKGRIIMRPVLRFNSAYSNPEGIEYE